MSSYYGTSYSTSTTTTATDPRYSGYTNYYSREQQKQPTVYTMIMSSFHVYNDRLINNHALYSELSKYINTTPMMKRMQYKEATLVASNKTETKKLCTLDQLIRNIGIAITEKELYELGIPADVILDMGLKIPMEKVKVEMLDGSIQYMWRHPKWSSLILTDKMFSE